MTLKRARNVAFMLLALCAAFTSNSALSASPQCQQVGNWDVRCSGYTSDICSNAAGMCTDVCMSFFGTDWEDLDCWDDGTGCVYSIQCTCYPS